MRTRCRPLVFLVVLLLTGSAVSWAECDESRVSLQVLGSAGPFGAGGASAGYIVWIDGVSPSPRDPLAKGRNPEGPWTVRKCRLPICR